MDFEGHLYRGDSSSPRRRLYIPSCAAGATETANSAYIVVVKSR